MSYMLCITLVLIVAVVQVLGLVTVAVTGARRPSLTLTWMVICILLPIAGFILYIATVGKVPKRPPIRWNHQKDTREENSHLAQHMIRGLLRVSSPVKHANITLLHRGNDFYERLLIDIKSARHRIDIEFYIFRWDEVGKAVVAALMDRAAAGVEVRFIRDGLGSRQFPFSTVRQMAEQGIATRVFFPVRFPFLRRTLNHRDHCKIIVIDNQLAYVGGMNIGLEYTGHKPSIGPWRDTHARIDGPAVPQLVELFETNWEISSPDKTAIKRTTGNRTPGNPGNPSGPAIAADQAKPSNPLDPVNPAVPTRLQFLDSGPDVHKSAARDAFFLSITRAERTVDITTPYFLPGEDLMQAITTAVARGVRIRLLLPEYVDHRLIGYACQTYFPTLLQSGVELYLWRPGVLHAKVMTVDGEVSIIGAANYDPRSLHLNYEVCLVSYGQAVADELRAQFEADLNHTRRVQLEDLGVNMLRGALHEIGRLLSPML